MRWAVATGDTAVLTRLLAEHERDLFVLCRGVLGHAQDAEDAVQETFLRALRTAGRFRGDAAPRTWLFRIAVNVCLDWKRARRLTLPLDDPPPAHVSLEATALQNLRLRDALAILLPRQRALLLLKEAEGWSVAEIAAMLGWSEKRVHNELYRARLALAAWREREALEGAEP